MPLSVGWVPPCRAFQAHQVQDGAPWHAPGPWWHAQKEETLRGCCPVQSPCMGQESYLAPQRLHGPLWPLSQPWLPDCTPRAAQGSGSGFGLCRGQPVPAMLRWDSIAVWCDEGTRPGEQGKRASGSSLGHWACGQHVCADCWLVVAVPGSVSGCRPPHCVVPGRPPKQGTVPMDTGLGGEMKPGPQLCLLQPQLGGPPGPWSEVGRRAS